jgi:class 3 adenylate cyclase
MNAAARMESTGVPGRIHVAASTRDLPDDGFPFDQRSVEVKGLGQMTTYLLSIPRVSVPIVYEASGELDRTDHWVIDCPKPTP